jgi:hypothetical protein
VIAGGRETKAFVDRWAKASLAAPVLAVVVFFIGAGAHRVILSEAFSLAADQEATTPEVTLPRSAIGGVRIAATAQLPNNRWAAYQVTVLAPDGTVLLELVKEAWAESGTWREDGESGTWSESDRDMLWDFRVRDHERVRFEVSVLDQGSSSDEWRSNDADTSTDGGEPGFQVPIRLTVHTGVTDGRFIALAFLFSIGFSVLAYYLAGHGGRPVIVATNDDSEVKGRAQMGGPGRLVAVAIAGRVDETAPLSMQVNVNLRDERGATHYLGTDFASVRFRTDEGRIEDGRFSLHLYFELPRAASWGIFVEAIPDAPMEHLKLVVRDRATTRGAVKIEALEAVPS